MNSHGNAALLWWTGSSHPMTCYIVLLICLSGIPDLGCRSRYDNNGETARSQKTNPEIEKFIDDAYALKREGKNGEALVMFEKMAPKVAAFFGNESEEMASLLDDQGSCYLRGGDYETAKQRYGKALDILEKRSLTNTRLFAGIHRRLRTIAAFETQNVQCTEPLVPAASADAFRPNGKPDDIPYFPTIESLHSAFYAIRKEMDGCVQNMPKPIPIWNVVTGDGRVILSSVKSFDLSKTQSDCLVDKLQKGAVKHRNKMPRFAACYRNFTYPVIFRE